MHLLGKKIFVGRGGGLKGRNREHGFPPNPTLPFETGYGHGFFGGRRSGGWGTMLWCWGGGGEGDTEIQRDILIDLFFEKKKKSWGRCDTSI